MNFRHLKLVFFASISILSTCVYAHGGKTDANGGHVDKSTSTYHCHKEGCETLSIAPIAPPSYSTTEQQPRVQAKDSEYDRKLYPHWVDFDGDCQDSRAEAFIRLSSTPVKFKRNKGCNVSHGTFYDPYTDKTYTKASDLDIDHVVPLKDAHESGAYAWDREKRREFANDPLNLIPVYFSENRSKGAKSPMEYMPPNEAYHCEYLTRWIEIKHKYNLHIRTGVKRMFIKACDVKVN